MPRPRVHAQPSGQSLRKPTSQAGAPNERTLLVGVEAGAPDERTLLVGVEAGQTRLPGC
jgi:hypothetical protein